MFYKRLSRNLKYNILVSEDSDIQKFIDENPNADYYESIYRYNEDHKKQFDKTKSLAGITGITTNKLVFDFDDKNNIENARKDAIELSSRLISEGIPLDQIQIYYSGNKGFHLELNTTESFNRKEFENILKKFTIDLKTIDTKVSDEQRIFRLPLTKHQVSKRYKIPLTIDQLTEMPIELIEERALLAKNNFDEYFDLIETWGQIELPQSFKKYKEYEEKKEILTEITTNDTPDFSKKPKHLSAAKFALQEGFFEPGERHEAYMILASTYKSLGYNKEISYNMLKATNRLQSSRHKQDPFSTDELWLNIVEYVYGQRWQGGNYSDKENSLLQKVIKKYGIQDKNESKIILINDVSSRFTQFAEHVDKNRIKTGINELDESIMITTGMGVGILGSPGSGKTSQTLNILEYNSMQNIGCFFGSHDMYDSLLFTRLLQKYCPYDMKKILDMVKNKTMDKKLKEAWEQVTSNFKNVGFSFQSGPTVEDLINSVDQYEQNSGQKVRLLVVDYLEKLQSGYSDPTISSGYTSSKLIDAAKDRDMALFLLLQPQKSAGDVSAPLLSLRKVKGSSQIEQNLRIILTTWRPGFNPDNNNVDDKYSSIAIVKNNMGPVGKFDFYWDGITGRIRSLTPDERDDFDRISEEQKRRSEGGGNSDIF